jgi:predicted component of type VI protein secretion system
MLTNIITFGRNWKIRDANQLELCTQSNHDCALFIASASIIRPALFKALITARGELKNTSISSKHVFTNNLLNLIDNFDDPKWFQ